MSLSDEDQRGKYHSHRIILGYILSTWHHCYYWVWPPGLGSVCQFLYHKVTLFPSFVSIQFSSVQSLSLTVSNPMDYSTLGFPVHHQLPELALTHVHWVCDAIQPSHILSSPSPPTFNLSQHQGLYQWVSSSHQVAKVLKLQHQSFQWIFRVDFL